MSQLDYHAFVPRRPRPGVDIVEEPRLDDRDAWARIRCPQCEWQPRRSSRWSCSECPDPEGFWGGCHTSWNTFETRGRCPGCQHQWRWTSCLSCAGWSLHDDWYTGEAEE
jgi:hypothetical protein